MELVLLPSTCSPDLTLMAVSKVPAFGFNYNNLQSLPIALIFLLTTCYLLSLSLSSLLQLPKEQDVIACNVLYCKTFYIKHSRCKIYVQKLINNNTMQARHKERDSMLMCAYNIIRALRTEQEDVKSPSQLDAR